MSAFWKLTALIRILLIGAWWAALLLAVLWVAENAHADVISDIGMGVKLERATSTLLLPNCHTAQVIETRPDTPSINYRLSSCGGDNPTFIGWPIAWEREYVNGALRFRGGWFHYSNWFDGGSGRETHMDVAAASVTINWSQWKRNRTSRR